MINRFRGSRSIASLLLACSASVAWGQLPAPHLSPLNQLGRSWGFGISDGYHECPECKKSPAHSLRAVRPADVPHAAPCVDCEQKPSLFSRMNPFKDSVSNGSQKACGSVADPSMVVLPPSPHMYQQFAAPDESTRPSPNGPSHEFDSFSAELPPVTQGPLVPESFPPSLGNQVPDPIELDSLENHASNDEATQNSPPDRVPPPPVLRKRQKGDRQSIEEGNRELPGERAPVQPVDKSKDNADDSLDLLPKEEPPPITSYSRPQGPGRSLISHATPASEDRSSFPALNAQEAMLRQYYGGTYSRPDSFNFVQPDMASKKEYAPPMVNRYR